MQLEHKQGGIHESKLKAWIQSVDRELKLRSWTQHLSYKQKPAWERQRIRAFVADWWGQSVHKQLSEDCKRRKEQNLKKNLKNSIFKISQKSTLKLTKNQLKSIGQKISLLLAFSYPNAIWTPSERFLDAFRSPNAFRTPSESSGHLSSSSLGIACSRMESSPIDSHRLAPTGIAGYRLESFAFLWKQSAVKSAYFLILRSSFFIT